MGRLQKLFFYTIVLYSHIHMAITSSAKKAQRVSARKQVFNVRRKRAMKGAVKDVVEGVAAGKDAAATLSTAYKAIDKAAKKGVIKKNTANRKKSRLARLVSKKEGK
jgi:small subunit ribosomal protein S20